MLRIYNTLTKEKEVFQPLNPGKVGVYVCGITVYDFSHIGHARVYIIFDMIIRYLKHLGYNVNYVRNITDIDDKIIKRSEENGESWKELTSKFIKAMHNDFEILNLIAPNIEPKATDHIPEMLLLVQRLIDKNYAYVGSNGDVYYDVTKFKDYGCLAHRHLDDLQAGARIEVVEAKRNPMDFVLWKMAKPGEPSWPSPWGEGRPGWHLECSAMSIKHLGKTFDIHGGGPDLKFPHHENELAQSEAATGQKFVNVWMHAGYLQIDKEKMSKSLGNFITIHSFLEKYHPEVLRYFNIISHYRSPVDYAQDNIDSAVAGMERLYTALRGLSVSEPPENSEFEQRFQTAMDDDFNTPVAFAVLFDIVRDINRARDVDPKLAQSLGGLLIKLGNLLGILYSTAEEFLQGKLQNQLFNASEIEDLILQRNQARHSKNWARADEIREQLLKEGIVLEDTSSGTLWRKETSVTQV